MPHCVWKRLLASLGLGSPPGLQPPANALFPWGLQTPHRDPINQRQENTGTSHVSHMEDIYSANQAGGCLGNSDVYLILGKNTEFWGTNVVAFVIDCFKMKAGGN